LHQTHHLSIITKR